MYLANCLRAVPFVGLLVVATSGIFDDAKAQSEYTAQDITDTKCIAAYSFVLGNMSGEASEAETNGVVSLLTYFVGKLKGRHPGMKLSAVLTPEFVNELEPVMEQELDRCGVEVEEMSADLDTASEILSKSEN